MLTYEILVDDEVNDDLELLRFEWKEAITGHNGGTLELIRRDGTVPLADDLSGHTLRLRFQDDEFGTRPQPPGGIVRSVVEEHDKARGCIVIRATLEQSILVSLAGVHCRTFAGETVIGIIGAVLTANGLYEDRDYAFRLSDSYPDIDFVAQFNESDRDFVIRLCETWGLSAVIEPSDTRPDSLVVADDPMAMSGVFVNTWDYNDSGYKEGVTRIARRFEQVPQTIVLQNYAHDFSAERMRIEKAISGGALPQVIVYPENFRTTDADGAMLAQIRAEELSCRRLRYECEAVRVPMRAGQICRISGHPAWDDLQLLVVERQLTFDAAPLMAGRPEISAPAQLFTAIPIMVDGAPNRFRPRRRTPKPRIHGTLHGIVQASDDRLTRAVDDEGSYCVELMAHGSDDGDVGAVYPRVRMAQPAGGAGAGMHFPLHPGTEVLLAFADGDPDRPYICGALPNLTDRSVVTRNDATRNILQTAAGTRLEFDNGPLTESDGGVSGEQITGKIYVPYDGSGTGSYLRLGHSDDLESPESRGPGADSAADGWYDFTNGRRTSVTMDESSVVFGNTRTEYQYGEYHCYEYDSALTPLTYPGTGTTQADAAQDAAPQQRMASDSLSDDSTGVSASYYYGKWTSEGITHYVKSLYASQSTYSISTDYKCTIGVSFSSSLSASFSNEIGLAFKHSASASLSLSSVYAFSYKRGEDHSVSDAASINTSTSKEIAAVESIVLSLTAGDSIASELASYKTYSQWIEAALTLMAVSEAAVCVYMIASADDAKTVADEWLNYVTLVYVAVAAVAAVLLAYRLVGQAEKILLDDADEQPAVTLTRNTGISMVTGSKISPTRLDIEDGTVSLSACDVGDNAVSLKATGGLSTNKIALESDGSIEANACDRLYLGSDNMIVIQSLADAVIEADDTIYIEATNKIELSVGSNKLTISSSGIEFTT